ncbi:hypothetical protein D3C81_1075740 [compost metagenome]
MYDLASVSTADLQAEISRREDATVYVLSYGDYGELTFNSANTLHDGLYAEAPQIKLAGNTKVIVVQSD